jgi:hypothetical protein
MITWTRCKVLLCTLLVLGCGEDKPLFAGGSIAGGSGDTAVEDADADTDTDADTDADTDIGDDTGPDTGEEGDESFDNPGDTVIARSNDDGKIKVDLSDSSGDSNREQEFYLVVINAGTAELGYTLRYEPTVDEEDEEDDSGAPPDDGAPPDEGETPDEGGPPDEGEPPAAVVLPAAPSRGGLLTRTAEPVRPLGPRGLAKSGSPPPPPSEVLDDTDIGIARRVFHARRSLMDTTDCEVVDSTLWAIGESVAIWVDGDVPIDRYLDCDDLEGGGFEEAERDAYGFDNCDLETIAQIVDTNIVPNVRSLLGDESDVNYDDLVSVLISPVLNAISLTSDDEDEYETLIESYTDPLVDLDEYDESGNPCSDYQEVIYVFAPDPYGYYNAFSSVTVDEYTSMELAGQIAQGMAHLIIYNQKVIEGGGDAEENWLASGIAAMAADLTGFGAIFFDDAWDYMDASHLKSLTDGEEESERKSEDEDTVLSTEKRGAQYLFFRWLVDAYGEDVLATLVQSEVTGADNILEATGEEFEDVAMAWQVALAVTGVTNIDGDELVSTADWSQFADATLASAPTSEPASGDHYGANQYQMGINVRGLNLYMEGGTTEDPTQIDENNVTVSNSDHFTYAPGSPFYGYLEPNFSGHVVRMIDIPYERATLEVESPSSDIRAVVIRWNDPETIDFKVEDVFSAMDATNVPLPPLPDDESEITGLGVLSEPGKTAVLSGGETLTTDVYDTDRWLLDLTDRDATEAIDIVITVDRRYESVDGQIAPYDLWAAIIPVDLLPTPTVDGTTSGSCEDGDDFAYPASMPDFLYAQLLLAGASGSDGVTAGFDPCGATYLGDTGDTGDTDELSCEIDWDRDDVLDQDEPRPSTLIEQVMVQQCTMAGGVIEDFEPIDADDVIDIDSLDDNDDPTIDRVRNLGGLSGDSDEEAYLETTVGGGAQYVIVVGAGTDTGPYEIRVRQVN